MSSVVGFVGDRPIAWCGRRKKRRGALDVGDLPASQKEGVRSAAAVDDGVNLRRATATRAPDGLTFLPPFAPLAER